MSSTNQGAIKRPKKSSEEKEQEKMAKKAEKEREKLKKKNELAKQKALKSIMALNRKKSNQEYCFNLINVLIDRGISQLDFFPDVCRTLNESSIKFNLVSNLISNSIVWERTHEDFFLADDCEVCTKKTLIKESHLLVIWNCKEVVEHLYNHTLSIAVESVKSEERSKKLVLLIYGIDKYFTYLKQRNKADQNDFKNLPKITKKQMEEALAEIQLEYNCDTHLIQSPSEMATMIFQFSKALATIPLEKEKKSEDSDLGWMPEHGEVVKVTADGHGLHRLWQQQLCQFPLVALDSADAIAAVYKTPLQLIRAYRNCSPAEGEILLRDIPVSICEQFFLLTWKECKIFDYFTICKKYFLKQFC